MNIDPIRQEFETIHPIPDGVFFDGVNDYDNRWERPELCELANTYNGIWQGWKSAHQNSSLIDLKP